MTRKIASPRGVSSGFARLILACFFLALQVCRPSAAGTSADGYGSVDEPGYTPPISQPMDSHRLLDSHTQELYRAVDAVRRPSQPTQPSSGPGGSRYQFGAFQYRTVSVKTSYGKMDYTVYEPRRPTPATAPVVTFLMGNAQYSSSAFSHFLYSAFYAHLARMGYIVIHPDNSYLEPTRLPPGLTADDTDDILAELIRAALSNQSRTGKVRPSEDDSGVLFALGGHSAGGLLAQMIANQAEEFRLPIPRALLLMDPTPLDFPERGRFEAGGSPMFVGYMHVPPTLENITSATGLSVVRTIDSMMADYGIENSLPYTTAYMVWEDAEGKSRLVNVPDKNYSYAYFQRDTHGSPSIESAHLTGLGTIYKFLNSIINVIGPLIPKYIAVNAALVDTADFGIWRRFEAMLNYQLKKKVGDKPYAFDLPRNSKFRSMGSWSDGQAVRPVLAKSDFGSLFTKQSLPFPARPFAPDGLLISAAPKLSFLGSLMIPISVHVTTAGQAPVTITSAKIVGPDAAYFSVDQAQLVGKTIGTYDAVNFSVTFANSIVRDKPMTARLDIEYEMNDATFAVSRNIEGRTLAPTAPK